MDIDSIRRHCLKKPGRITETFPFDDSTLVFKVNGKMFLLASIDERPLTINLKCDPARAIDWREQYDAVQPGYHMNKRYWNTVAIDGSISTDRILEMMDHSYDEVVRGLPKNEQARLNSARGKKNR
ncbi:MAG TPA: MmcQ/YjbR family DNA-binding protein [Bacteroidota bacterium]|nr:MmcQ/YjbR family DNA-binding protein [Bacteroidota bacterium]